jgi:hypothetical protein
MLHAVAWPSLMRKHEPDITCQGQGPGAEQCGSFCIGRKGVPLCERFAMTVDALLDGARS